MKAYIIKIVGAALIGTFAEYLAPRDRKKYVKLISGILMLSVLLIPFKTDTDRIFFEEQDVEEYREKGQEIMFNSIKDRLEINVANDITNRIIDEFSKKIRAEVKIKTTADKKIESVEIITLYGAEDNRITERLKFVYGTEAVRWIKE